jgi:predicted dehydrogenase
MKRLRVAMIGYGFMGAAHSQGWRTAPRVFDLPVEPEMAVLVGRNADAVAAAARKWGWAESATDWRDVIAREDIDVVDIVTPGDSHAELAIAALEAGKHVLCEKPLANTVAEAELMVAAAEAAAARGVLATVGFTYRRVPAVQLARQLVVDGRIGRKVEEAGRDAPPLRVGGAHEAVADHGHAHRRHKSLLSGRVCEGRRCRAPARTRTPGECVRT